jgi:hypothetical protein
MATYKYTKDSRE